jgi:pimeloyl-ACP methyl ester carboxylesterase
MEVLVFVPGIMGSELVATDGETVWPPTPLEVVGGYRRIDKLLRPDLQPGQVIGSVCIDIYGPLLEALTEAGYGDTGARRLRPHPYDWRRDLGALSDELEATLADLVETHGPEVQIKLVCHSMGGLVARGCLESPRSAVPAWAGAVRLCVFLATPHDGAPLAFARAIGVGGGSLGLSPAQLRQVAAAAG